MAPKAEEQLSLGLEEPTPASPKPKAKRRRFEAPPKTDRRASPSRSKPSATAKLLAAPAVAQCGFCGRRLTVFRDAGVCPVCGAIVTRTNEVSKHE